MFPKLGASEVCYEPRIWLPSIQFRREAERKLWKGTDLDGLDKEIRNITYASGFAPNREEEGGGCVPAAGCGCAESRSSEMVAPQLGVRPHIAKRRRGLSRPSVSPPCLVSCKSLKTFYFHPGGKGRDDHAVCS